jgi:hypothetical protein
MRTNAAQAPPPPEVSRAGSGLPRITRLLALAVRFEGLLREGTVRDYAELARLGGVSRATNARSPRQVGLPCGASTLDRLVAIRR